MPGDFFHASSLRRDKVGVTSLEVEEGGRRELLVVGSDSQLSSEVQVYFKLKEDLGPGGASETRTRSGAQAGSINQSHWGHNLA